MILGGATLHLICATERKIVPTPAPSIKCLFPFLVQEQGLKNFEFGDTQYTQGLTTDYYRGDPGDCP